MTLVANSRLRPIGHYGNPGAFLGPIMRLMLSEHVSTSTTVRIIPRFGPRAPAAPISLQSPSPGARPPDWPSGSTGGTPRYDSSDRQTAV
jgi:hypothetical protein